MKPKLSYLLIIIGVGMIIMLFRSRTQEELVTESTPTSSLDYDAKIAKTPYETATFGMGWFWGPDSQFGSIEGVLRTRVGYAGGDQEKPSYTDMGDHTEAISIDYDPTVISYGELLQHFWKGHRCERNNSSTQYMNAIFYRNDEQRLLASASLEIRAASLNITKESIATKILPVKTFTYAEKYHQKYAIRGSIREQINALYPDAKSLADSTIATRINAYLGNGVNRDNSAFLKELPTYNLPTNLEQAVREQIR